jgi:hypothetical protein
MTTIRRSSECQPAAEASIFGREARHWRSRVERGSSIGKPSSFDFGSKKFPHRHAAIVASGIVQPCRWWSDASQTSLI